MNDLLAKPFTTVKKKSSSYVDLKRQDNSVPDLEMGMGDGGGETEQQKNLGIFFEEVSIVKKEMEKVKPLLCKLQEGHEESKGVYNAQAMKALRARMDADMVEVLRIAKALKVKVEELEQSNIRNRHILGCEQGTPIDRTRLSITNALRKKLKDLMGEFKRLREEMMGEYKETMKRRYYTVTGLEAEEEMIESMIGTGESENFLQKAILEQEQGTGHITDTVREIQERHDAVKDLERNLLELHQVFLDMAVLVDNQGEELNDIEHQVHNASAYVDHGSKQLHTAKKLQRGSRKCMFIAIILFLILVAVIAVPIAASVKSA